MLNTVILEFLSMDLKPKYRAFGNQTVNVFFMFV